MRRSSLTQQLTEKLHLPRNPDVNTGGAVSTEGQVGECDPQLRGRQEIISLVWKIQAIIIGLVVWLSGKDWPGIMVIWVQLPGLSRHTS